MRVVNGGGGIASLLAVFAPRVHVWSTTTVVSVLTGISHFFFLRVFVCAL